VIFDWIFEKDTIFEFCRGIESKNTAGNSALNSADYSE